MSCGNIYFLITKTRVLLFHKFYMDYHSWQYEGMIAWKMFIIWRNGEPLGANGPAFSECSPRSRYADTTIQTAGRCSAAIT